MTDLNFPALGQSAHHAHQLMEQYPEYTTWVRSLTDTDLEDEYNERHGSRYADDEREGDKYRIVNRVRDERRAGGRYLEDTY